MSTRTVGTVYGTIRNYWNGWLIVCRKNTCICAKTTQVCAFAMNAEEAEHLSEWSADIIAHYQWAMRVPDGSGQPPAAPQKAQRLLRAIRESVWQERRRRHKRK